MLVHLEIPTDDQRHAALACVAAIEVVTALGMREIGNLPPLYQSGIVYVEDPPGPQRILRPAEVFARGRADCKSLIVYRLCELRAKCGEPSCSPRILWLAKMPGAVRGSLVPVKGLRAHAVIRRADKSQECPSTLLGMR
jgi:hypothetical protein